METVSLRNRATYFGTMTHAVDNNRTFSEGGAHDSSHARRYVPKRPLGSDCLHAW